MILIGSLAAIVFELIEILILFLFLNSLSAPAGTPRLDIFPETNVNTIVYDYVVSGPLSAWFWWGVIGVGIVAPLVLGLVELTLRRWEKSLAGVKFALLIVGGALLRFVVVWGGEVKPLVPLRAAWLSDLGIFG